MTTQKPHPVELVNYFFPEQSVRANPRHQQDETCTMVSRMAVNLSPVPGDLHACELTIELDEDASTNPTYFYRVVAYGVFSVSEDLEAEKIDDFIGQTSVQILAGVTRERVAELTSRGPWGPVLIKIGSVRHGLLQDSD